MVNADAVCRFCDEVADFRTYTYANNGR